MRVSSASSALLQGPRGRLLSVLDLFKLLTFDSHTAMAEKVPVTVSAVRVTSANDSADGFPTPAVSFKCPKMSSGGNLTDKTITMTDIRTE